MILRKNKMTVFVFRQSQGMRVGKVWHQLRRSEVPLLTAEKSGTRSGAGSHVSCSQSHRQGEALIDLLPQHLLLADPEKNKHIGGKEKPGPCLFFFAMPGVRRTGVGEEG